MSNMTRRYVGDYKSSGGRVKRRARLADRQKIRVGRESDRRSSSIIGRGRGDRLKNALCPANRATGLVAEADDATGLAYIVVLAWWLVNTRSDKARRGSRAEINRRALHNARPEGGEASEEKRGDEGKGPRSERAWCTSVSVCSRPVDKSSFPARGKKIGGGETGGGRKLNEQHTRGFVASSLTHPLHETPTLIPIVSRRKRESNDATTDSTTFISLKPRLESSLGAAQAIALTLRGVTLCPLSICQLLYCHGPSLRLEPSFRPIWSKNHYTL